MNNFWWKIILFVAVIIIVAGSLAANSFANLICVRLIGIQQFVQMAKYNSIASFAWGIFMPVILLVGIILIRPSKLQKA